MHGLQHQKDVVDARIFALKLSSLVRGLKRADKIVNGRNTYAFVLTDLKMGSATARIREQQANVKYPPILSSVGELYAVFGAVYNGKIREVNGSKNLVSSVQNFASGASKTFSHIEIFIDDYEEEALRVDDFFTKQAASVASDIAALEVGALPSLYKGVSFGAFDGTLKAVDLRGIVKEAKLTLTAGGKEIDCVCNGVAVPELRENLDRRAIIEGIAHYDGIGLLPARIDIKKIHPIKEHPNFTRWKGAFDIPEDREEW